MAVAEGGVLSPTRPRPLFRFGKDIGIGARHQQFFPGYTFHFIGIDEFRKGKVRAASWFSYNVIKPAVLQSFDARNGIFETRRIEFKTDKRSHAAHSQKRIQLKSFDI